MHTVDIEIECIAQTRINPEAMRRWLDRLGATATPVPRVSDEPDIYGPQTTKGSYLHKGREKETTDATALCGFCSKRCYMSFEPGLNPNVSRVRKEWVKYWTNVLKSGHGSVTEHATWTFSFEGVSRVFTAEMNRHRAGMAISEGSMRYIRFDDIGFWMPLSLREGNISLMPTRKCKACKKGFTQIDDQDGYRCTDCAGTGRINLLKHDQFEQRKHITRMIFKDAFEEMEKNYTKLCKLWSIEETKSFDNKKKLTSLFRRLIGMGVATGGCWTFNTRAMRHIMALRTGGGVEEEIAWVMGEVGKYMVDNEPSLFGDFERDEATGAWLPKFAKV